VCALVPGPPDDYLRNALIIRGLATGLMFMPVMAVAMDNIAPAQIPRATALSNVLRQLAGAFATAMFASLLLDHIRLHTAALAQVVTPGSTAAVGLLAETQLAMVQRGLSVAAAHSMGLLALTREVQLAATVRAFDDCFRIATFAAVLGIVPALFLTAKRRVSGSGQRETVMEAG